MNDLFDPSENRNSVKKIALKGDDSDSVDGDWIKKAFEGFDEELAAIGETEEES